MTTTDHCPDCNSTNTTINISAPFKRCEDCGTKFRGTQTCHLCGEIVNGPWNASHGVGTCTIPTAAQRKELADLAASRGFVTDLEAEDMGDYSHLYD